MPIGVAVLVVTATALLGPPPTVSPAVKLSADSTVLLVCGVTCPTWHEPDVEIIMDQFITPTHPSHPGDTITPVAVTTPSEFWPITGLTRLIGVAFGDPRIFGPGGSAWPDEPWWKLSGLFDLTSDQSELAGVAALEAAMAKYGNDHLVIYGESAGANTVNKEKRKLAAQYPSEPDAPDIEFVLMGDPNVPNGGIFARFPGLYIPILDLSLDGPEPTDTPFHTDVINRQYDGVADFPLYPLNVVADLNALLGVLYLHLNPFDVSLPADDPTTSPAYQGTYGDSSYYLFPTQDLPLFAPLRSLGVPEPVIDVVEPFFRVLVELGYDRSIPLGEPTPARLIPRHDPATVVADLADAVGEGIDNAAAVFGLPQLLSIPASPAADTGPATSRQQQTIVTDEPKSNQQAGGVGPATSRQKETDTSQPASNQHTDRADQPTSNGRTADINQPTSSQQDSDTAQARSSKQRGGADGTRGNVAVPNANGGAGGSGGDDGAGLPGRPGRPGTSNLRGPGGAYTGIGGRGGAGDAGGTADPAASHGIEPSGGPRGHRGRTEDG